ncbi:DUF5777 family beta-barrel protein [Limibacter armeniacum]|uniref:DUF5777 family beta-barrel protein n=1 Tax=Limibacter armeniacum TaxID=466084 RepID=UPI002FE61996
MKRFLFFLLLFPSFLYAQDDLLEELKQEEKGWATSIAQGTFKGTRIINGHSVETRGKNVLEFVISHRFGTIKEGFDTFFGLDDANIRLALEYGVTDRLTVALGRSSLEKTIDAYLKYKVLQQDDKVPISLTAFTSIAYNGQKEINPDIEESFQRRTAYTYQLLLARKFSNKLSLQVMPSFVHRNLVLLEKEKNGMFAIGFAGRYKITQSLAITSEYYLRINEETDSPYHNAFGIGVDIETGGHVFQLQFTNARAMVEKSFITETIDDFFEGDIHFGFNITRVFYIGRNKK